MKRILVLLLLLLPSLAFALDNPAVGEAVAGIWSGVVIPVLSAACLGVLGLVLDKLRRRYNLQIDIDSQKYLEGLAQRAVALAEEKGAAYLKANITKITGRDKLDIAIAHILTAAPKLSREQADNLVHTALARVKGAGATGDKAVY